MTDDLVSRLRAAGCVYAEDEVAVLLRTTDDPTERERLCTLRVEGLPLEQVVGWAEFGGLRIGVRPGVFVPRRRSEFLARRASDCAHEGAVVLDMCCGTGALGLAVSAGHSRIGLHAVDADAVATACATENKAGTVYLGNLYRPLPGTLRGSVDVIVAVTPYVPSGDLAFLHREARLFEPAATHDGGIDGLRIVDALLAGAGDWLAPGGAVLLEVSEAQGPAAVTLAQRYGLTAHLERDEDLDATILVALV